MAASKKKKTTTKSSTAKSKTATKSKAAKKPVKQAKAAAKTVKKTTAKTASAQKEAMEQLFGMETLMQNTPFQFDKITQDASAMGQAQMEAAIKSSTTLFKGMEDIMKTCMEIAQEGAEKNAAAVQKIMACKTLNEYTEAQNKLAQENFDKFMTGATKISEMSVRVCTEAMEPMNDQINKSIKQAAKAAAA